MHMPTLLPAIGGKDLTHLFPAASGHRADPKYLPELAQPAAAKKLTVVVGQTFPLAQAADAHRLSETGHGRGRIVLTIA